MDTQEKQNVEKNNFYSPKNTEIATGLKDLYIDGLKDIYWAENALTKAIPKMIKQATSTKLIDALTKHLAETENHVKRLESIFKLLELKPEAKKCDAMEGIIKEGNETMELTKQGVVRDAGIIGASQKVEHYEIATYGTLCAYAKILGETEAVEILLETLMEENAADNKLSEIAEAHINLAAAGNDAVEQELPELN